MPTLQFHQLPAMNDQPLPIAIVWREDNGSEIRINGLSAASLDDATRKELRWYFEDSLDERHDPPTRPRAERLEQRMVELGEELFRALFQGSEDARDLWVSVRDRLADTRIEITTGVAETTAIPWELLRDPRTQRPLALTARELVRAPTKPAVTPHRIALAGDQKLRILLVICRPDGSGDVPFRSVAGRLFKALNEVGGQRLDLTVLRPPTFEQLGKVLEQAKATGRPFHLVHFDGHGTYGEPAQIGGDALRADRLRAAGPRGYLLFENPAAQDHRRLVDGQVLGALLHRHGVAGLVLNACQSADVRDAAERPAEGDQVKAQGSLAQEAMEAGLGAVLAMRYVVWVETAALYVGRFYELVAAGRSFATAATAAREALATQPKRDFGDQRITFQDWPVPVVFETNPLPLLPPRGETALFTLGGGPRGSNDALPPPPAIGFIGRDSTLLALDRAFDRHHVVLLHAYAGSGKTTTAIAFARWYRDTHGVDGPVWFDSFESHRPLARLLDRIEEAFGPLLEANRINWGALDPAKRARTALDIFQQNPVLWLWDNVEEVAGFPTGSPSKWTAQEQAELREFLARLNGTKARVLLTSRRDERGWLGDLPVRVRPEPMPMRERRQMAAALAEQHQRERSAVAALQPLLEWTQGNPMTLTVVVGQALRDQITTGPRVAAYLARLRVGEQAFTDDAAQGRSKSLGASLDYGFNSAFSEEEQVLLSLLHLFQGLVDVNVLIWMGVDGNPGRAAPYAGRDQAFWLPLLNRAAELGLLTAYGGEYFGLHPALPWFLKARFDTAFPLPHPPAPLRAWVEAIGALANHWANRVIDGDHAALDPLCAQEANLLHARALALSHGWWDPAVSTMQGLRQTHQSAGRWAAWAELVAEIVPLVEHPASGEPLPGREEHWSLVIDYRVALANHRRDGAAALALLEKVVIVKRHRAEPALAADPAGLDDQQRHLIRSLGVSLQQLGTRQCAAGDAACLATLGQAKAVFERAGLRHGAAIAAFNLGHAYKNVAAVCDLAAAEAAYRESLDLIPEDDRVGRAKCHNQLGLVAWDRCQEALRTGADAETVDRHGQAAVDGHHTALALLPADAHPSRAVAHNALGIIFEALGQLDPAAGHYRQDIRHSEAAGDHYGAAQTRWNLADLLRKAGRFADARDYALAALHAFDSFDGRAAADVEKTRRLLALIEAGDATS